MAWAFYDQLLDLLTSPVSDVQDQLKQRTASDTEIVINGVASSFLLQTKVSLVAGLVGASPIWLYELWAFIMPGLHRNERRWTIMFVAVAGPLFFAGVMLGYYVLPKGLSVLIGFTPGPGDEPDRAERLPDVRDPGAAGLRGGVRDPALRRHAEPGRGRQGAHSWRSTAAGSSSSRSSSPPSRRPSTDPITMLLLAIPMIVLFLISEVIARIIDRRRGRNQDPDYADFDDDEVSPI